MNWDRFTDIDDNSSTSSTYVQKAILYLLVPIIAIGNARIVSK